MKVSRMGYGLAAIFIVFTPSVLASTCTWELDTDNGRLKTEKLSSEELQFPLTPSINCSVSKVNDLIDGDTTKPTGGQARILSCSGNGIEVSHELDCMYFHGKTLGFSNYASELKLKDAHTNTSGTVRLRYLRVDEKK